MSSEKIWWTIGVRTGGVAKLEAVARREGMPSARAIGSSLVEWFASQSDSVKLLIVGGLPHESASEIARQLLRQRK